jgi:hypothetical protein
MTTIAVLPCAIGEAATDVAGSLVEDTVWNVAGSPYVLSGDVTVPEGMTLEVMPGVIVKASSPVTELSVFGRLTSRGTREKPILWTSHKDDTAGGDTNGDGAETAPGRGDWVGIGFAGTSRERSRLEFSEIRYAQYYGESGSNFERPENARKAQHAAALEARVKQACIGCHLFPEPSILPGELWPAQIRLMGHLASNMQQDPKNPFFGFSVREALAWYESKTPKNFNLQISLMQRTGSPLGFRKLGLVLTPEGGPEVATIHPLRPGELGDTKAKFITPNMKNGSIHLFSPAKGPVYIGEAGHPVQLDVADLDGDGRADLLISDLGEVDPTDDLVGRVLVGRNMGEGVFDFAPIMDGLPRVTDARAFDIDEDGDLDVVVAAFGWLHSGGIYLLRNGSTEEKPLQFRLETITQRAGAVSIIPVVDLLPGRGPGVVVAFSQQHELVSAFHSKRGKDESGWEEVQLYRAPHPNWGITNLHPVDLDGDNDLDFLLSSGDTLSDGFAYKPYHGVEWLRNNGSGVFESERVGSLYGAHRAAAADIDGDGDLDVVASGFLPQLAIPFHRGAMKVDSLAWYERSGTEWIAWSIETNHPRHTGMAILDLNNDGRLDIVAGVNQIWDQRRHQTRASLEAWLNLGPSPDAPSLAGKPQSGSKPPKTDVGARTQPLDVGPKQLVDGLP